MAYPRAWQQNVLIQHCFWYGGCSCRHCVTYRDKNLIEGIPIAIVDIDFFTQKRLNEAGIVGLYRCDEMIEFDVFTYPDEGLADYTTPSL